MINQKSETTKIQWHHILGKLLEELLSPTGIKVLTEVSVLSQPPKTDILLLRQDNRRQWTKEQKAKLPDGIRDIRAGHVLIEFKYSESVNKNTFRQTICYDYLYETAKKLKVNDIKTFIVTSKSPRKTTLQKFGYQLTGKPGVYYSNNTILDDIPLILLNDLSNEPHNAWIKCFASKIQEKHSAFKTLSSLGISKLDDKLKFIIQGLLNYWFKIGGKNMEELTPERVMEYGKELEDILLSFYKPKDFLAKFDIKDIVGELTMEYGKELEDILLSFYKPKDFLAKFDIEDIVKELTIEDRLKGLAPEEIEKYLEKIKK